MARSPAALQAIVAPAALAATATERPQGGGKSPAASPPRGRSALGSGPALTHERPQGGGKSPAAAPPRGRSALGSGPALNHGPTPSGVTQRIVESITAAIVERRLMPGTKLAEQQIADIFKVSRTLVRQALNQLSRDRLVTLTPARGACVATPGVDEARQVFELRTMIESAMVRQLCEQITATQIAVLRAHLRSEREAVVRTDVPGRTRLLADFHVLLARQLGNEVLAQLLADLLSRSSLIALMYQSAHSASHSQDEHVGIVDALERRDADACARLMAGHLADVAHNLQLNPRTPALAAVLQPRG